MAKNRGARGHASSHGLKSACYELHALSSIIYSYTVQLCYLIDAWHPDVTNT